MRTIHEPAPCRCHPRVNRGGPFLDEAIDTALDQEGVSTRVNLRRRRLTRPGVHGAGSRPAEGVDLVQAAARASCRSKHRVGPGSGRPRRAFLDDDDIWEPTLLTTLVGALASDPLALGAYSVATTSTRQGTTSAKGGRQHRRGGRTCCAAPFRSPRSSRCFLKAQACRAVGGFDPGFDFGEDNDFILRLLQRGPMVGVDPQLVGYRRHQHNATNGDPRVRAAASDRLIRLNRTRALASGDTDTARLLTENLARFRAGVAQGFGADLASPGEVSPVRRGVSGLREGFSTNPRTFTAGVLGSVVRYSRRSRQRDPRVGNDLG